MHQEKHLLLLDLGFRVCVWGFGLGFSGSGQTVLEASAG